MPTGVLLCLLVTFPSMAEEARLQRLISQAGAAIARVDRLEVDRLFDEIFALTTGLDPAQDGKPAGLTDAEYEKKLCPYRKAVVALMTEDDIFNRYHEARLVAYRLILSNEDNAPHVLAIINCSQDSGDPVLDSLTMKKGLKWARKLKTEDITEAREMAREYEELIKRYPNTPYLEWLHFFTKSEVDGKRIDSLLEESGQLLNEGLIYQSTLVEKADQGDLTVQLEVASRLETGDKFRQDHRFAYFWYKRARQNGGGKAAQNGLDRLHPQLDWLDHELVEMWLRKKHRPY